jgi:uracil-DNA glycosylase
MNKCPVCNRSIVPPYGPTGEIIAIAHEPGHEALMSCNPWSGRPGEILLYELQRAGIAPQRVRFVYMYQHPMPKDPSVDDLTWHIQQMNAELIKAKYALLLGTDVTKYFLEHSIVDVNGISFNHSRLMPATIQLIMPIDKPESLMSDHGCVGDMRVGLERFNHKIKELEVDNEQQ